MRAILSKVTVSPVWLYIRQVRLAHLGLAFAGLMLSLPFLFYKHELPITTFYQEWCGAFLGFCAMLCLAAGGLGRQPQVPRIALLPVGMALLVLVQVVLGKIPASGQALMFVLYMLYALLMMVLGFRLRDEFGLPKLAAILAVFVLAGSELNALAGVAQHFAWRNFIFDTLVTIKIDPRVYGNLAQPNHFADQISLGLASLGLLFVHWRMRTWLVALLASPLLFVLVLSGSRGAWLFLGWLAIMGGLWAWMRRDVAGRQLLYYSVCLLAGLWLMGYAAQTSVVTSNAYLGTQTISERIAAESLTRKSQAQDGSAPQAQGGGAPQAQGGRVPHAQGGSVRLTMLKESWLIFIQNPVAGVGFGQFAWQHFLLGPVMRDFDANGLWLTPHNLVAQVAAEMGMIGLAILGGGLVLWLWQARGLGFSVYAWWGGGMIGVIGLHALLEYPLAYTFFMGVAALALGGLDRTVFSLGWRWLGHLMMAALLLAGGWGLWQTWDGYQKLEKVDSFAYPGEEFSYYRRINHQRLMKLHGVQYTLYQPRIEFLLGETDWDHAADGGALNMRVLRTTPVGSAAYRQVSILAQQGNQAEARKILEAAIWAFPKEFPLEEEMLRELAKSDSDPERLMALREFGLRANDEWYREFWATH